MKMGYDVVREVNWFKYLETVVQNNNGFDDDVRNRIIHGYMKWREASGILCDKSTLLRLKDRFDNIVVKPVILYGSEYWAVDNITKQRMSVAEMKILKW